MKEFDIFDVLPAETFKVIDREGYAFLRKNGYPWRRDLKLKKELKRRGEELQYCHVFKDNAILFWFELRRGEEVIAKSGVMKFIVTGGANGESVGGKEGTSPFAEFDP